MHIRGLMGLAGVVALLSSPALAAPPVAPEVTVGADLKQLVFDWDSVPGASSYQLWYRASSGAPFTPVGGPIAAAQNSARVNISVHKLNWAQARYKVSACNSSGCTDSAEVSVQDLMLDAIGYFKSSKPGAGDLFGLAIVVSANGKTLVISAPYEAIAPGVVDGSIGSDAGAVYVFRRSGSGWHQEAHLKPDTAFPEQYFGAGMASRAIAVNASGTLIAVGAPNETNLLQFTGRTYIYRRASEGSWSQLQKLASPVPITEGYRFYGAGVDMSDDGNTLRVLELKERDGEGNRQGEHHIYVRSGSTFVYDTTLTIPHHEVDFCSSGRMSADGKTFVQGCYSSTDPRIVTWKRGSAGWTQLSITLPVPGFGQQELVLNGTGTRLAFQNSSHPFSTNVQLFGWNGTTWVEEATIETPAGLSSGTNTWGSAIALDRSGNTLAIGDLLSRAGGAGVSNSIRTTGTQGGAVFLYARTSSETKRWTFRRQVKAPNPDEGDNFGLSVAFCGTSATLAIGAISESSAAAGIDGNQLDNSKPDSGAVYLY
jgi:hypothetical protein